MENLTALTQRCEWLRTVANRCERLRTVADGCGRNHNFKNFASTASPPDPQVKREPSLRIREKSKDGKTHNLLAQRFLLSSGCIGVAPVLIVGLTPVSIFPPLNDATIYRQQPSHQLRQAVLDQLMSWNHKGHCHGSECGKLKGRPYRAFTPKVAQNSGPMSAEVAQVIWAAPMACSVPTVIGNSMALAGRKWSCADQYLHT